jgi:hypothetical protein
MCKAMDKAYEPIPSGSVSPSMNIGTPGSMPIHAPTCAAGWMLVETAEHAKLCVRDLRAPE